MCLNKNTIEFTECNTDGFLQPTALIIKKSDMVFYPDGNIRVKRKYGNFKREVIRLYK